MEAHFVLALVGLAAVTSSRLVSCRLILPSRIPLTRVILAKVLPTALVIRVVIASPVAITTQEDFHRNAIDEVVLVLVFLNYLHIWQPPLPGLLDGYPLIFFEQRVLYPLL